MQEFLSFVKRNKPLGIVLLVGMSLTLTLGWVWYFRPAPNLEPQIAENTADSSATSPAPDATVVTGGGSGQSTAIVMSTVAPTVPVNPPPQSAEAIADELILEFPLGTTVSQIEVFAAEASAELANTWLSPSAVYGRFVFASAGAKDQLPNSSLSYTVFANYRIEIQQTAISNDPESSEQWALPLMNVPQAWPLLGDAETVRVAVVDSGTCPSNPELDARILEGGRSFVHGNASIVDELEHGCPVMAIIAAEIDNGLSMAGIAPNTSILPLRVLDGNGYGTYADVAAAIYYAVEQEADLINLSLGGLADSRILADAVAYAIENGVMVIAAAGNTSSNQMLYPAAYPNVISVGAVNAAEQVSSFSSSNDAISLYAPGENVLSLNLEGKTQPFSGTSFAAPMVTGVAAVEMGLGYSLVVDGGIVRVHGDTLATETPSAPDLPVDLSKVDSSVMDAFLSNEWVDVVVTLNVPQAQNTGLISPQAVASAQSNLLSAMQADSYVMKLAYSHIPAMSITINETALSRLSLNSDVVYIMGNTSFEAATGDIVSNLGIQSIRDSFGLLGDGITVAVLDTRMDASVFGTGLRQSICMAERDCSKGPLPDALHGTIMGRVIQDIAPDIELLSFEVLSDEGQGKYDYWLNALNYILANHASLQVDLVSMSLSTQAGYYNQCNYEYSAATSAIQQLRNLGVLVLTATGNNGNLGAMSAPACIDASFSVAASYDGNTPGSNIFTCESGDAARDINRLACFSNRSSLTDVAMAGAFISVNLGSEVFGGSGTSHATAAAAAVAALVKEANPNLTAAQIENILRSTGVATTGQSQTFGLRRIDPLAAITTAQATNFSCNNVTQITRNDCNALVSLFLATDGENSWTDSDGWLESYYPCDWLGVNCSGQYVSSIDLAEIGLYGTIPSELGSLSRLVRLDLSGNRLYGAIPASFNLSATVQNPPRLESLDLSYNSLTASGAGTLALLSEYQPTWDESQTIAPINVNAQAVSTTTIRIAWNPIPYAEDTGGYTVNCGLSASGPFDALVAAVDSKLVGEYTFTNAVENTNYFCVVYSTTAAHEENPYELTSSASSVATASTTPEGIRDGTATFIPSQDAFISSTHDFNHDNWRFMAFGYYVDYSDVVDVTYANSYGLLDYSGISLPDNYVVTRVTLTLSYYGTMDITNVPVAVRSINAPWNDTRLYSDGIPSNSGNYIAAGTDNVMDDYDANTTGEWPIPIELELDPTVIDALLRPNDGGLMIARAGGVNDYGAVFCSVDVDGFCRNDTTADDRPTLRVEYTINMPPSAATNPFPANDSLDNESSLTLSWQGQADPQGDDYFYDVYMGDSPETLELLAEGITETEYANLSFDYGQLVYWRVDTYDELGRTTGETWNFRINVCDGINLPLGECQALREFARAANLLDTAPENREGWFIDAPCDWEGISCQDSHVTRLELAASGLTGYLSDSLGNLSALQYLDLSANQLEQGIPDSLANLSQLRSINLANNLLVGSVPLGFSAWQAIESIDFSGNVLSGSFPTHLLARPNLQTLKLSNNRFEGVLPNIFNQTPNLTVLAIDRNLFNGALPSSLGNSNITDLNIAYNAFAGAVPASIVESELLSLDLGHNMLWADAATSSYLTSLDSDWSATQTIGPRIERFEVTDNTITLYWNPIAFSAGAGAYVPVCAAEIGDDFQLDAEFTPDKLSSSFTLEGYYPGERYVCAIATFSQAEGEQKNTLLSPLGPGIMVQTTENGQGGQDYDNPIEIDLSKLPINLVIDLRDGTRVDEDPRMSCSSGGSGITRSRTGSSSFGSGQTIRITVSSSETDPIVAVYVVNSANQLEEVACNDNHREVSSEGISAQAAPSPEDAEAQLDVFIEPGREYYILFSYNGRPGLANVNIQSIDFTACASAINVPVSECEALLAFAESAQVWQWENSDSWRLSADVCLWYGVVCEEGHVVGLQLRNNNLHGFISPAIAELSHLRTLDLSFNYLGNAIPSGIGTLPLESLHLEYNLLFSGDMVFETFLDAENPAWRYTQTLPMSQLEIVSTSSSTATLCWTPIAYTGVGFYEIGYSTVSGGPYTFVAVGGDKSVSCYTVTGLPSSTTLYFVGRSNSYELILEERWLQSDISAEVTLTTAPNLAPNAVADVYTTLNNGMIHLNLLANDSDPENDSFVLLSYSQPAFGRVDDYGSGDLRYQPNPDFVGVDTFTYTIIDSANNTALGTVTIYVQDHRPNTLPFAVQDTSITDLNTPLEIDVLGNDADTDGDSLSISSWTSPAHGTVQLTENNRFLYSPNADFSGTDGFEYTVSDGRGGTATATVSIAVNPAVIPTEPVNLPPMVVNESLVINRNGSQIIDVLLNDYDPEGTSILLLSFGQGQFGIVEDLGNGSLRYQPNHDYLGSDSFEYHVQDADGNISVGTVQLEVIENGNGGESQEVLPETTEVP